MVAQLVDLQLERGMDPGRAPGAAWRRLGAYRAGVMFSGQPELIDRRAARRPLAVGYGEGEMYVGSDALALAPFTKRIGYLRTATGR